MAKGRKQTTCSRCGDPCEEGPWKEQLCNRCALTLGQQEIEAKRNPPAPTDQPPLDLFGPPPAPAPPPEHDGRARHTDPDTSHEAARKARTGRIDLLILDALDRSPAPLAYWQVAAFTEEREVVVSPRFAPLERWGYIERVRKEINPKTHAACWTWKITERGRAVLEAEAHRAV